MIDKTYCEEAGSVADAMMVKRTYTAPKLQKYGQLLDLTQAKSGTRTDYGGGSIQTFFEPER